MTKFLLNLLLFAVFIIAGLWLGTHVRAAYGQLFPEPEFVTGNYDALMKEVSKPVVMFATSTCPHCQRAREYLKKSNVAYQEFLIDESPDAKQKFEVLGGSSVPLLFIGHRRIVGFRENIIAESLRVAATQQKE